VIERACALAEGEEITRADLPEHVLAPPSPTSGVGATISLVTDAAVGLGGDLSLKDAKERWLQVLEASYLRDLLARNDGNISAAAKSAGIDRKTFHRLINKYQLR
jgi:transcriptional regulator of acetoin/glycerol metabolism